MTIAERTSRRDFERILEELDAEGLFAEEPDLSSRTLAEVLLDWILRLSVLGLWSGLLYWAGTQRIHLLW